MKKKNISDISQILGVSRPTYSNSADRISTWKNTLLKYKKPTSTRDSEILKIPLDLPNQSVIRLDCIRTRAGQNSPQNFAITLEKCLTYYCKKYKIKYRQGMNEIIAPFLLLCPQKPPLSTIIQMFNEFIDSFMPTYFIDDEFTSFQCSLCIVKLLLRYHDPKLEAYLLSKEIAPELFATSPLLTMLSQKTELKLLYLLWDCVIEDGDIMYFSYIYISLLILNRELIFSENELKLPETLCNLKLNSKVQLESILNKATELRTATPPSFLEWIKNLGILNKFTPISLLKNKLEMIESLPCIQIQQNEIAYLCYPNYKCNHCSSSVNYSSQRSVSKRFIKVNSADKGIGSYNNFIKRIDNEIKRSYGCQCNTFINHYCIHKQGKPIIVDIRKDVECLSNTHQIPVSEDTSMPNFIEQINNIGNSNKIFFICSLNNDRKKIGKPIIRI